MTDRQINNAIADACGFVCLHEFQVNQSGPKFAFWDYPPTWTGPKKQPWLLDFCNDLNAMHEAEKVLSSAQRDEYWDHLKDEEVDHLFATARERAEAFLLTLGKWEPTAEDSSVDHIGEVTEMVGKEVQK